MSESEKAVARAMALFANGPDPLHNPLGRTPQRPPAVTTFECIHDWKAADDRDPELVQTLADLGYLMCKKCRGYWRPLIGWTREPRRMKGLMTDSFSRDGRLVTVPHGDNARLA